MADTARAPQQLSAHVESGSGDAAAAVPRLQRQPALDGDAYPASLAQERLWFLAQLYPDSPFYNEPIVVRFHEPVDEAVLERCFTEIVRRHEAWRTVFENREGRVLQRVLPPQPFSLSVIDCTERAAAEREAEALRLGVADARRPFDLVRGPLLRALLVRLTAEDQRLFVTAHHLVVDGLSFFQVFLPELHALHRAFSAGQSSPLPEPEFQYRDYVAWHSRFMNDESLVPQLGYWQRQLAQLPQLDLPTDLARPAQPTWAGARVPVLVPKALTERLRALARQHNATLFTAVLAIFKVLLHRYTGQSDFCVGSAASGRRTRELDALIGFFSSNLVLRTSLASEGGGAPSFAELIERVRDTLQAARANQDIPFERMIAAAQAPRVLHQNPLFDASCILMPPLPKLEGAPHWTASRFDIGTAKLDLYLELHQRPEGLCGHIEYRTDLFREATIARMAGHLLTLLADAVDSPDQSIAQLRLLTDEEDRRIASWQGQASREASPLPCLHHSFEAQALRTPQHVAAVCGSDSLTYAELNQRADRIARRLREQGVGRETIVGLLLERSLDIIAAVLGVLKGGGAYLPLNPQYPVERLRFLLEDSGAHVVLAHRALRSALPATVPVLEIDSLRSDGEERAADAQEAPARPEQLAYVIYTSGSTGQPKGVAVEHRSAANLARVAAAALGIDAASRLLWCWSFSFDCSVGDLFMALTSGATLVIARDDELVPGAGMLELIREQQITTLGLPPSALAALPCEPLPLLQTLFVAGEALSADLVARWAPGRRMHNLYGPTEATVYATAAECAGSDKPSIGRPLPNLQAYVLDQARQRVPEGIPGELYIGGAGVARGYLRRDELTRERFVVSPFASHPERGERLYRTGDLVRWRTDGSLDFLGRVDRQVKLRGFRIEPDEIEAVLRKQPDVQDAAVVVREDLPGDRKLVAYVALRDGQAEGCEAALLSWLKSQLPDYMVPALLVRLERLPLSPNGKLDRKALPMPTEPTRPSFESPASELESKLVEIWKQVLRRATVSVSDNFFDLGGHSLRLAEIQARIASELGRSIAMLDLFRYPTVRELAGFLAMTGSDDNPYEAGPGLEQSRMRAQRQQAALAARSKRPPARSSISE